MYKQLYTAEIQTLGPWTKYSSTWETSEIKFAAIDFQDAYNWAKNYIDTVEKLYGTERIKIRLHSITALHDSVLCT